MGKKVIVTGVTGQDGSYMVEHLLSMPDVDVVFGAVRRQSNPNYSNCTGFLENPRFKMIPLDLTDPESVSSVIDSIRPDYFINFAANSFVGTSWDMPINHFQTNAQGVLYILESVRKFCPKCRVYSSGSSEEYGDVLYSPQDINHPLRPRSPYGASKCSARHLVKVYRDSYNLHALQGILYNHESPRRSVEFVTRKITHGIGYIKNNFSKGFSPIELGNLDARRDWSHAIDFVRGVWLMIDADKPKEYILSSGETHSVRDFICHALDAADIPYLHHFDESDPTKEKFLDKSGRSLIVVNPKFYRPAEVELLLGDSSEARNELGWSPEYSFEELVRCMVEHDIVWHGKKNG